MSAVPSASATTAILQHPVPCDALNGGHGFQRCAKSISSRNVFLTSSAYVACMNAPRALPILLMLALGACAQQPAHSPETAAAGPVTGETAAKHTGIDYSKYVTRTVGM